MSRTSPALVLVRHGESWGNLTGDYSTNRHDNLTETGWAQARALAAHWAWEHWRLLGYPRPVVALGDAALGAAVLLALLAPARRSGSGRHKEGR